MAYEIEVAEAEATPTVVMVGTTTFDELSTTIGRLINPVWAYIRSSDLVPGHNVVLYKGAVHRPGGAEIEVGVEVDRRIEDAPAGGVRGSELPGGRVVRTMHRGPYNRVRGAYEALDAWCLGNGEALGGPTWEIYGDWDDDSTRLEATVVYKLA